MIDREMIWDIVRYLFDGLLISVIWLETEITLLSQNALWFDTFGEYANTVKTSIQVIITLLIALTAFYRLLREIHKYRNRAKDENGE